MATAAVQYFPNETTQNHYCKIPLQGQVAPHSKAKLAIETLKYLMFQRQQIPLPFEQLKYQQQLWQKQDKEKPSKKLPSLEQRRWANLVQSTEELISNIDNLFSLCKVSHILIIFGATIVSPKEVHHVRFTDGCGAGDDQLLSTKHCQREFMKAMITNNSLLDAKALPLTAMHVMVFAHRQSGLSWFKPRASFKMNERGKHYIFEVQCRNIMSNGIQYSCEPESDNSPQSSPANSIDFVGGNGVGSSSGDSNDRSDTHMWFEAPLVIKGVKDKSTKKASSSDIWT